MASGKTTFGRALAQAVGWDFLDLDEEIERRERQSIPEIMTRMGESGFRQAESMALKRTGKLKKTVIACGGGTPTYRDNMEFMTLHGKTLWLVASPEKIAERVLAAGPTRPLVADKSGDELTAFITGHLRRRQPYYCRAEWRMDSEHLETEAEIASSVSAFLKNFPFLTS